MRDFLRELRIRRYKHRKVKVLRSDPVKDYTIYFNLQIKSGRTVEEAEQVFDITIPERGFHQAKRALDEFLRKNLVINVIHFKSDQDDNRD